MTQPLDGVTVADFTQMMQGPWATMKLADLGADVVKVERVGGEWERDLRAGGELLDGESPFFLAMNRNKRSVELDLSTDAGREVALDLIAEADALVENFRPGVMDRLGLGYEDARAVNDGLVYVSASGFGGDGPYADRPGQDLLLQAMSGLAANTGRRDDPPTPAGTSVVDEHSASLVAFQTVVALFHRERTGEGQHVETNLYDAAVDLQCQELTAALNMDRSFERSEAGVAQPWLGAPYGIYETADGHVAVAMCPMETLADATGVDEFRPYETERETYEHRDEITRTLEAYTRERETDALLEELLDGGVWAAPVQDFHEVASDPQVQHNEMVVELDHPEGGTFRTAGIPGSFSETPGRIESRPPRPGEHTDEVLAELGYGEDRIRSLADRGVTAPDGE